jgi:8-oxo-dGTP pyrophosphatase MutT (NUDIX family)
MIHLHQDASLMLTHWQPVAPDQVALRSEYLDFLARHQDATARTCRVGHLTASALVVNPDCTQVLLTLHPKVNRWLQLGGHMEPGDPSVQAAAIREVIEESSVQPIWCSAKPLRLDRHAVPCAGGPSEHLDMQFLVHADPLQPIAITSESLDLRWFAHDALPEGLDDSVLALIRDARLTALR